MGQRFARVLAGFTVAVLAAGLAGCQSNPKPRALPSRAASSTSTPLAVATPSAPVMPAAAKGSGRRAAKAFALYWIKSLNYATHSGETRTLRLISSPRCVACAAIADAIDGIYKHGGSMRGDGWSPITTRLVQQNNEVGTVVDVLVTVHPQVVKVAKGSRPKRFLGGRRVKTLTLQHAHGGWMITKLEQSR